MNSSDFCCDDFYFFKVHAKLIFISEGDAQICHTINPLLKNTVHLLDVSAFYVCAVLPQKSLIYICHFDTILSIVNWVNMGHVEL